MTKSTSEVLEQIDEQATFTKAHLVGIIENTDRRVTDYESWYIGVLRGRQLSLEWLAREIRGEDHYPAEMAQIEEDLDGKLTGVRQF